MPTPKLPPYPRAFATIWTHDLRLGALFLGASLWISVTSSNVVAIAVTLLFLGLGLYRMTLPLRQNYLERKRMENLKEKYQTNPNAVANAENWRRRSRVLTEKIAASPPPPVPTPEVSKPGRLEQLLLNSIRWRQLWQRDRMALVQPPPSKIPLIP